MAYINLSSGLLGRDLVQDVVVSEPSGTVTSPWWRKMIKSMQYGRMLSVVNGFSDETLAAIGVNRSDIPAYVWRLIEDPQ